jgi:protein xylosyltransferase
LKNVADYGTGDDDESSYNNVPSGSNHRNKLPPDKDNSASSNEYYNKALQQRHNYKTDNFRVLRLDELGFIPPCDISGRESVSALHRAKSQFCKQIIANISCLMKTNPPYPKRLPHQCPTNGIMIPYILCTINIYIIL